MLFHSCPNGNLKKKNYKFQIFHIFCCKWPFHLLIEAVSTCVYREVSIEQQGPIPPQWVPPQGASQDKGAVGLECHVFSDDHIANTKSEF